MKTRRGAAQPGGARAASRKQRGAEAGSENAVDAYLRRLPDAQRAALQALREVVRSVAPDATECISYGVPVFKHAGKSLVGFGAAKQHCSFFPMGSTTVVEFADRLAGYSTSKGTIRFTPNAPLPKQLVRSIVKARLRELAG